MKKFNLLLSFFIMGAILACARPPRAFIRTTEPAWSAIELRKGLSYEDAWALVVDALAKKFELEMISQDGGYIRTSWLYNWTGTITQNYRVRAIVKFSPDKTKVDIKTEAEYGGPGKWTPGWDENLLTTLKTDIMGTVGRATK
jgi:hypothetical protein